MTDDPRSDSGSVPGESEEDEAPAARGATVARFFVLPLLVVGTALVRRVEEGRSPEERLASITGFIAALRAALD